jgi:hypothetical protein
MDSGREVAMAMRVDAAHRRKEIAHEMASVPVVQRSDIIHDVALKYGVCTSTVRSACKEHRVTINRLRRLD